MQIEELQKAVGDCKLYLYDEREQVLKLQAENDNLKAQEVEDRRRIQQLLSLTEPANHEVRQRGPAAVLLRAAGKRGAGCRHLLLAAFRTTVVRKKIHFIAFYAPADNLFPRGAPALAAAKSRSWRGCACSTLR